MDLREFKEQGYIIIDDFLEKQLASNLLSKLKNEKNWFRVDQKEIITEKAAHLTLNQNISQVPMKNTSKIAGVHKNTKKVKTGEIFLKINF